MERDGRILVLRIIDRLNVGGSAIHAVLATAGLDPARFRTVLVTGAVEPEEADMSHLLETYGVERILIPALGRELRPLRDLATLGALVRLTRRLRPDIVHTHKSKAGALGRLAALAARVPVVVHTFHGHVFHGYFGAAKTRAFLAVERTLARRTNRLVALSPGLVDELADRYRVAPRSRFAVVPLGLDLDRFAALAPSPALRDELGLAADVRLVGIVGRMVPVKDHQTFVGAAGLLAARHPTLHFVFVGGGECEAAVRDAVRRAGLERRAHFLGWRRDLPPIYAGLDVLALSSLNEGTPVTLIEAMAAGVPVASTEVGGVRDLLADGARGQLAPPRDEGALAQAIERALSPEAKLRAQGLRQETAAAYGQRRLASDLARLYVRLLNEK